MNGRNQPIIIEQAFNVPVSRIWNVITNVAEMRHWFFSNIPDFRAQVGFKTFFDVSSGKRNFRHQWKIINVTPKKKIVYDWSYAEYEGEATVNFEIFSVNSQTVLRVTSEGMDSFNADIPEFERQSCIDGWNYFIKQRLVDYISSI